jgi:hypothetical protein
MPSNPRLCSVAVSSSRCFRQCASESFPCHVHPQKLKLTSHWNSRSYTGTKPVVEENMLFSSSLSAFSSPITLQSLCKLRSRPRGRCICRSDMVVLVFCTPSPAGLVRYQTVPPVRPGLGYCPVPDWGQEHKRHHHWYCPVPDNTPPTRQYPQVCQGTLGKLP